MLATPAYGLRSQLQLLSCAYPVSGLNATSPNPPALPPAAELGAAREQAAGLTAELAALAEAKAGVEGTQAEVAAQLAQLQVGGMLLPIQLSCWLDGGAAVAALAGRCQWHSGCSHSLSLQLPPAWLPACLVWCLMCLSSRGRCCLPAGGACAGAG